MSTLKGKFFNKGKMNDDQGPSIAPKNFKTRDSKGAEKGGSSTRSVPDLLPPSYSMAAGQGPAMGNYRDMSEADSELEEEPARPSRPHRRETKTLNPSRSPKSTRAPKIPAYEEESDQHEPHGKRKAESHRRQDSDGSNDESEHSAEDTSRAVVKQNTKVHDRKPSRHSKSAKGRYESDDSNSEDQESDGYRSKSQKQSKSRALTRTKGKSKSVTKPRRHRGGDGDDDDDVVTLQRYVAVSWNDLASEDIEAITSCFDMKPEELMNHCRNGRIRMERRPDCAEVDLQLIYDSYPTYCRKKWETHLEDGRREFEQPATGGGPSTIVVTKVVELLPVLMPFRPFPRRRVYPSDLCYICNAHPVYPCSDCVNVYRRYGYY